MEYDDGKMRLEWRWSLEHTLPGNRRELFITYGHQPRVTMPLESEVVHLTVAQTIVGPGTALNTTVTPVVAVCWSRVTMLLEPEIVHRTVALGHRLFLTAFNNTDLMRPHWNYSALHWPWITMLFPPLVVHGTVALGGMPSLTPIYTTGLSG